MRERESGGPTLYLSASEGKSEREMTLPACVLEREREVACLIKTYLD